MKSDADPIACSSSAVLPIPGLPPQHQHPAVPGPRALEQPVEHRALVSPTAQHRLSGAEEPTAM